MKSKTTTDLENAALRTFKKLGTFLCLEVGINIKQLAYPIWYERYLKNVKEKDRPKDLKVPKKVNREITEIVDLLVWEKSKDIWKCYEIKSSIQDFNSGHHITFVGHYNYYIMTKELYEKVKNKIPSGVGVYILVGSWLQSEKKAKKQKLSVDEDVLKYSLIKSLYRDKEKLQKQLKKYKKC